MNEQIQEIKATFDKEILEVNRLYRKGCITQLELLKKELDIYQSAMEKLAAVCLV